MKVLAISDLHGNLPKNLPEADIALICGDIVPLVLQRDEKLVAMWMCSLFTAWAEELPVYKVFFIAGNHDCFTDKYRRWFPKDDKVTYLEDEEIEYVHKDKTYRIYGTPWCKKFGNWFHNLESDKLYKAMSKIPKNLDILMTHEAPFGETDRPVDSDKHLGSDEIRQAIIEKEPRYVFHGHIHSGSHDISKIGTSKIYNVSILDEAYEEAYQPLVLEL